MRHTSLIGSRPNVIALPASTTVILGDSPFSAFTKVKALAAATPTIYGVNRQTDIERGINYATDVGVANSLRKYQRLIGDGSTTAWTSTNYPNLANAHDDAAALTNANRLRLVLVANGVSLTRVQSDATPGASEFKVAESGGVYTLTAKNASNAAFGTGTVLELFMAEEDDVITVDTLAASVVKEITCYDFMVATTAAALFAGDHV